MTDPRPSGNAVPAGWYPDPGGTSRLRYWDGAAWTEHWADPTAPAAPASPPPPAPAYAAPAPPPPLATPPAGQWTPPPGGAPKSGMSGCVKALLIVLVLLVLAGAGVGVAVVVVAGHVVHHLVAEVSGTAGRPSSLPSSASDYSGERTQDHVAGPGGTATVSSLNATARDWARTTATGTALVCGDVVIHRSSVSAKDPFDLVLQLGGDYDWELVPPSGSEVSLDQAHSAVSAMSDYLTSGQTGDASGRICFPDPGGHGQFEVTWQPRVLRAERLVWVVDLR